MGPLDPPGWYPTDERASTGEPQERWWDGIQWTDRVRVVPGPLSSLVTGVHNRMRRPWVYVAFAVVLALLGWGITAAVSGGDGGDEADPVYYPPPPTTSSPPSPTESAGPTPSASASGSPTPTTTGNPLPKLDKTIHVGQGATAVVPQAWPVTPYRDYADVTSTDEKYVIRLGVLTPAEMATTQDAFVYLNGVIPDGYEPECERLEKSICTTATAAYTLNQEGRYTSRYIILTLAASGRGYSTSCTGADVQPEELNNLCWHIDVRFAQAQQ